MRQVVALVTFLDAAERDVCLEQARREGLSLQAWLRAGRGLPVLPGSQNFKTNNPRKRQDNGRTTKD